MHFTPEELKSFPLWALEENDTFAITQWLGDWVDVIKAVQTAPAEEVPITEPDVYIRKPTNVPLVVKWLEFGMSELDAILKRNHTNCELIATEAHGALLSNGDLVIQDVRVANHTGNPYSTHTLRVEKAPTVLFTRGLGAVVDQDQVPSVVVNNMSRHLEFYQYDKQNIIMPSLEDLVWTRASGYPYDATLTDEQQLESVLAFICAGTEWTINHNHVTFENGTLYTTPDCPISGAVNLRG